MTWTKTSESLPANQQEILIRYAGTTNIAKFDSERRAFLMGNGSAIPYEREYVEWMPLNAAKKV
jgi:hypothetical protein